MLTKHQHASLEITVDVVLLLCEATKIVMSCPHLKVTSCSVAPACGEHKRTQHCSTFSDCTLLHAKIKLHT